MQRRQFVISILAFLVSNLLSFVLFSAVTLSGKTIVIVGWSFIALQALVTIALFLKKKMTAAMVGAIWVGATLFIQLLPWIFIIEIILFYCWPALVALALWLVWKNYHKMLIRKLAFGMIVVQGVWIVLVVIRGILGK